MSKRYWSFLEDKSKAYYPKYLRQSSSGNLHNFSALFYALYLKPELASLECNATRQKRQCSKPLK